MRWQWGAYKIGPPGSVSHTTAKSAITTPAGIPYAERASVTLAGTLLGTSQADLSRQQAALELEVSRPYRDLVLFRDDGGVAIALWNRTSLTGVRKLEGPIWDGTGGNYSTFLGFSGLKFEADYPLPVGGPILLDFIETVTSDGGNWPEFTFQRPINSGPVKQMVYPSSPYTAVQSGTSTSRAGYFIPPPLWPEALMKAPSIRRTPRRVGAAVVAKDVGPAIESPSRANIPEATASPTAQPVVSHPQL